ncbi:uncharacterized protein LOC144422687 [Styela clava]
MDSDEERGESVLEMAFSLIKNGFGGSYQRTNPKRIHAQDLIMPNASGCSPISNSETLPKDELVARTTGSTSLNGNTVISQQESNSSMPFARHVAENVYNMPTSPYMQEMMPYDRHVAENVYNMPTLPYMKEMMGYNGEVSLEDNNAQLMNNKLTSVFLTYGDEASIPSVIEIYKFLKQNLVEPHVDFMEQSIRNCNKNVWANDRIRESSFIIVCVNANYNQIVNKCMATADNDDASYAAYTFNALQSMFIHNGCLNYKVIPVLIDGAVFSSLPLCFQSTDVYRWPDKRVELLDRIFKNFSKHI